MSVRKLFSLSVALALVYSISLPARAELLKNLKTDGSIEVRTFGIDNEVDFNGATDDYRSETHTRVFVGGSSDLLDDVHSRVLLRKNNRIYGGGAENANTVQTNVIVDNAYAKIDKVFGHVDLTMGRQFYGTSDDLVIYFGPQSDDVLTVTALDVFRVDTGVRDLVEIQGIAGKLADGGATGVGANSDTDLWGIDVNTDKVIPKGNLASYYYTRKVKNPLPTTGNNTLNVYGVRAGGDVPVVSGLGYKAEYVQNFGRNNPAAGTPAYDGNAYFLGLKWGTDVSTKRGAMPVRAHGEYGRGSRDFLAVAPAKRFGKIWGEHSTVGPSTLNGAGNGVLAGGAGLTNLKVLDAGVGLTCPVTKAGLDLNWYRFIYDDGVFTGGRTSAGTEYDLVLSYKHSDNVSFEASAASFQVGDALQNAAPTGTSPITRLGADVKVRF